VSSGIEHIAEGRGSIASGLTMQCQVHFKKGRCGQKVMRKGQRPPSPPVDPGRIPRVSRLMALAIHFDSLIKRGLVCDYADIARLGLVTRARVTQIMNLLLLAPDIQEEILRLPRSTQGRDAITERHLRAMTSVVDWGEQRSLWKTVQSSRISEPLAPRTAE
jgi:hypothetical protein